jgi:hypothetical protein
MAWRNDEDQRLFIERDRFDVGVSHRPHHGELHLLAQQHL